MKTRILACLVTTLLLLPAFATAAEKQDRESCLRKWEKHYYTQSLKDHPNKEDRPDAFQQLINDHKQAEEKCNAEAASKGTGK